MLNLFKRQYQVLNKVSLSRSSLVHNHRALGVQYHGTLICPVLKSNAYGHGLESVAPIFDSLKPAFLCVDSLFEAYKLQRIGIGSNILILGYTVPENFKAKPIPFHVPLFDLETAAVLNKYQRGINIHIKIDTGMNRFGIRLDELNAFLDKLHDFKHIRIKGLYSHLSSADEAQKSKTRQQIEQYKQALHVLVSRGINPVWRHIHASAGMLVNSDDCFNITRVGLASYGISPIPNREVGLRPALEFKSRICQIKHIRKDDTVSYNDTFRAPKEMTIGIIGAGYYEGVDRRLSNAGNVLVRGTECRILGRVCMNITVIDLSQVPEAALGDECVVYSCNPMDQNSISNSAKTCKTIPYELLVKLNETVRREVVE